MTWALLLSAARRVVEGDRIVRSGGLLDGPPLMLGVEVTAKPSALSAPDASASRCTARAGVRNEDSLYCKQPRADFERETGASFAGLNVLLSQSDFVSSTSL